MNSFLQFALSPRLHDNLKKNLFVEPTLVQTKAIPPALTGKDVVATAQTGTGKTLAFLLPLIDSLEKAGTKKGAQALILSPTRELAIQSAEAFDQLAEGTGLRAAVVVGGLAEYPQLNAIRRGAQVIIATPGRLEDYLDRKLVDLRGVRIAVLDEGDRMLDMGFQPSIERIFGELPADRQTLFFSATIEPSITHLIEKHLKDPVRILTAPNTRPADMVDLHVYEVDNSRKLGLLLSMIDKEKGSFLVFTRTKHGADKLALKLMGAGVRAARIHGDRTQAQRNSALERFRGGRDRVLVATDVAARGIHVDNIAHVVNYDLPQAPEDFVHRVGRTGRAGLRGVASTFGTPMERHAIRRIERTLRVELARQSVPKEVPAEQHVARNPIVEEKVVVPAHGARKPFHAKSAHGKPLHAKAAHGKPKHGRAAGMSEPGPRTEPSLPEFGRRKFGRPFRKKQW